MQTAQPSHNEDLRQLEHFAPIAFAFLLKYLTWVEALALALVAVLYGLFLSARLWRITQRPEERERGFSPGKLAYGLSIFFLILIFREEKYIVAATWANLAAGDAASNLIGRNLGRRALPWNKQKTWEGMLSAFLISSLLAHVLILWTGFPAQGRSPHAVALAYACSVSIICSLAETACLPLDDNFTICIAGGLFLSWLSRAAWPAEWDLRAFGLGLGLSVMIGLLAYLLKTVTQSGLVWGILVGAVTYYSLGLPGFLLLGTFFVLGSLFSRVGYSRKLRAGVAQADQGIRSGRQVWGKGFAAFVAALAALFLRDNAPACLAFVSALAASLYDTSATELGQLLGKRPVMLPRFERVPRGTRGAVSLAGSILGLLAAAVLVWEAVQFRFIGISGAAWALMAAAIAAHLEGYLASRPSAVKVGSPMMNALHTTLAMAMALALARIPI